MWFCAWQCVCVPVSCMSGLDQVGGVCKCVCVCVSFPWHTSRGDYSRADSAWLNAPREPAWMELTAPMRQGRRDKAHVGEGPGSDGRGRAGCVNHPRWGTRTLCVGGKGWETRQWPGHNGTLKNRNYCSSIWFLGRSVSLEGWEARWQWAWWMSVPLPSNICGWLFFVPRHFLGFVGNWWEGEVWFFIWWDSLFTANLERFSHKLTSISHIVISWD